MRALMGNNLPPRFKFKDTYDSIEVPTTHQQHLPSQATLEAKFDELIAEEDVVAPTTQIKADMVVSSNLEVGTSNLFVDTETGNVGIGTTSPGEALHIYRNDANPTYMHIVSDTSNRAGIALSEDKTNKNVIIEYDGTGSGVGNYLAFYSGISSWVGKGAGLNYVPANGHVGIGTSSPSYKLDVAGTSNAATYYQNGVELYAQRRWEVDLTGQSTSNFYPVELKAPSYEGSPDLPDMFPVHFKVFGESLGGGSPYNESTLVGYARGGGWSDHKHMYDVHYKRYSGSEKRFEGLYRGTQDYGGGIVIYMRGGYRYSVLTDATEVNTYTSAQTLDNSVFAIKDVDGGDVSGTSTAIGRIVHIAGTNESEKRFMSGNLQFDGNVGIGTTSPSSRLTINAKPEHRHNFDFSDIPLSVNYNSTVTSNSNLNDPKSVMILTREGTNGQAYAAGAAFQLSRWEDSGTNSRSRLDIALKDSSFDLQNIMTMRSNGNVGIGTTSPTVSLYVQDGGTPSQSNSGLDGLFVANSGSSSSFFNIQSATANGRVFAVTNTGVGKFDGGVSGSAADYAEMFEWIDGNPDDEDRRGLVVELVGGDKIQVATSTTSESNIIGVVSAEPCVLAGESTFHWTSKWLKDDFGSYQMEDYEAWQYSKGSGEPTVVPVEGTEPGDVPEDAVKVTAKRRIFNPDYDDTIEYVPRSQRKEWSPVGVVGRLRVKKGQPARSSWVKLKDVSEMIEEWFIR